MIYVLCVAAIAETLQKFMEEKRLRVKDLMNKTGLSRPTVSRHVNGKLEPNYEDRAKYAQAFGVTMDEFESRWQKAESEMSRSAGVNHDALAQVSRAFGLTTERLLDELRKISPRGIAAKRRPPGRGRGKADQK